MKTKEILELWSNLESKVRSLEMSVWKLKVDKLAIAIIGIILFFFLGWKFTAITNELENVPHKVCSNLTEVYWIKPTGEIIKVLENPQFSNPCDLKDYLCKVKEVCEIK